MRDDGGMLPEASEDVLYQLAYSYYNHGLWQKAIRTFRLLVMFAPYEGRYWYGLGSSLMVSGDDEEASQAYQIASIHSPSDPRPFAFWAECLARLGSRELSETIIAQAEEKAKNSEFKSFQDQIDVIKERVIKQTIVR